MCGIIGYIGEREAAPLLYKGLLKLEYRGYDSAGFAVLCSQINSDDSGSPSQIVLKKDKGKIREIAQKTSIEAVKGNVGIAHTRWATHGKVTKENAHPHTSCDGKIAVTHNGIIENYAELREELKKKGHTLKSETDTEVIAHLIEDNMKQGKTLKDAVFETTKKLRGSYAILAVSCAEPDKIVAARYQSPLVVGVNGNECFVCSDSIPFLEYTKEAIFVDDGDVVVLTKQKPEFYHNGNKIEKHPEKIEWDIGDASKNGHAHFLIKEIYDQPLVLRATMVQDVKKLQKAAHMINAASRVAIVACGTSRHASLVGRYVISELSGKYCEVYMASEFQYFAEKLGKDTLIIAVSQSGETADVLDPVRTAKKLGCKVISLVNVVGSSLDRESDLSFYLNCGPEISVASTKAFTSQLVIFYLLAYTMAYDLDKGKSLLNELPEKITETIKSCEPKIKELAQKLKDKTDFYYIARGENFAVATEGALKLKEISYIHAEGMPAGELKHGTLALIDKEIPVVAICPCDHTYDETISNIEEAKARGAFVIGISNKPNNVFDVWLQTPEVPVLFYPLLANIPCQLLAYYLAVARGTDVDQPRNLAKSVTVK